MRDAPRPTQLTPPDGGTVRLGIALGDAVKPVLARVMGVLAARADFELDRLNDALLITDTIAADGPSRVEGTKVEASFANSHRSVSLRVGPFRTGSTEEIVSGTDVSGTGGLIRQLADSVSTETEDGSEWLVVRIEARSVSQVGAQAGFR